MIWLSFHCPTALFCIGRLEVCRICSKSINSIQPKASASPPRTSPLSPLSPFLPPAAVVAFSSQHKPARLQDAPSPPNVSLPSFLFPLSRPIERTTQSTMLFLLLLPIHSKFAAVTSNCLLPPPPPRAAEIYRRRRRLHFVPLLTH